MKKYQFFEHTADTKFIAYGSNLEEAFINAALATTKVMTDDQIKSKIQKTLRVESPKKLSLLYDFLQELIFLLDTEAFLLSEIPKLKISNKYILEATILGDKADSYEIKTAIKAITYNEMFIKEQKDLVKIQVVPDV